MIAIFWYVSLSIPIVIVFIPGAIITFVLYLNPFQKNLPKPDKILPVYLVALGIQLLHFAEEYVTDFHLVVPELLNQPDYPLDYLVVFNMVAYAAFILGTIVLMKQIKVLMVIPLFFIVVGVFLNSVGHVLISIYVGGYFCGLYTAIIYFFLWPVLIKRLSV